MKSTNKFFVIMGIVALLPSCGRLIDWAQDTFYQGKEAREYKAVAQRHLRSVTVYDQLDTVGMFDVLWLSDEIREAYAATYMLKLQRNEAYHKAFLRRQLEENNHFMSFYVLSLYDMPLHDKKMATWSLSLRIGNEVYQPLEIKEVELTPEYKFFFGKKFNRYKTAFVVKFAAQDVDGRLLLDTPRDEIALYLHSVAKEVLLVWKLDTQGRAMAEHRIYPSCGKSVSIHQVSKEDRAKQAATGCASKGCAV